MRNRNCFWSYHMLFVICFILVLLFEWIKIVYYHMILGSHWICPQIRCLLCIFCLIEKQRWSYACGKQLIKRLIYGDWTFPSMWMFLTMHVYHTGFNWIFVSFFTVEVAEHGLQFTIVGPFNRIGPRMEFILGMDSLVKPFERFYHASIMFVSISIITCTSNCIFFYFPYYWSCFFPPIFVVCT